MNSGKNFHIIENLYYLCLFIVWCSIGILAIFAGLAGILFLGEKLFPDLMHSYNYTLSTRTFDELKANRHYHAAISFMEYKQDKLLEEEPLSFTYLQELSDCYMRVGDYSKAERTLLELYKTPLDVSSAFREEFDSTDENYISGIASFRWSIGQELFKMYDIMGDREGMRKAYGMMQENDSLLQVFLKAMRDEDDGRGNIEKMTSKMSFMKPFYRLDNTYEDNPNEAIDSLKALLDSLQQVKSGFQLRYESRLVEWMLEQNRLFEAYEELSKTIRIAEELPGRNKYNYYGRIIDHCLRVNDYQTGRRLLGEYWHYVKQEYEPEDMEYIQTQIRELRFLEKEGRWNDIESRISDICYNLQSQIEKNFIGMSEDQREFFAHQIDAPFSYAYKVLQQHPSSRMASLCLDNQVFKKGLLLRSSQVMRNTIAESGNPELVAKYDSLVKLKRELAFREYLSMDPRNALRKREVGKAIEELDKSIALGCSEYTRLSDTHSLNHEEIQRSLDEGELLLEFVDTGGDSLRTLFAIMMSSHDSPQYVPLCRVSDITGILRRDDVGAIYSDNALTKAIWGRIQKNIDESRGRHASSKPVSRIYYSPSGLFCQLALHALPFRNGTLNDVYRFHQLSNSQNIAAVKERGYESSTLTVSLWGGITYSAPVDTIGVDGNRTRGILRGDSLVYLPSSNNEVMSIARLLESNRYRVNLYRKDKATEGSFKARSGADDAILHISTHGFFKEDAIHEKYSQPMYNSGLFFAGANRYWMNDSVQMNTDEEDGILRAVEIQDMNLVNCRLAILSACDTGLGFVDTDEGVYGLQRAFKLAGVKKIIMSLWPVSDYHTAIFMEQMYRNLIEQKMDIESAYQETLHDVRSDTSLKGFFSSPSNWGGFVLLD